MRNEPVRFLQKCCTTRHLSGLFASCFLGLTCLSAYAASPDADEVKLARYSTAAAEPAPNADDPLAVVAHIQFPRASVSTVGQAVRYLLMRTGYSLVDTSRIDAAAAHVLTLPLPESDRVLGTYRVQAMLAVLIGKSFAVQVNPLDRTVTFVQKDSALAATEGLAK